MYFESVYTIELYGFGNNASVTSTTGSSFNVGPMLETPIYEESIVIPAKARNKELLEFRKALKQSRVLAESRLLATRGYFPVACKSSQVEACPVSIPSRARARMSFRPSVLERRALPRMES